MENFCNKDEKIEFEKTKFIVTEEENSFASKINETNIVNEDDFFDPTLYLKTSLTVSEDIILPTTQFEKNENDNTINTDNIEEDEEKNIKEDEEKNKNEDEKVIDIQTIKVNKLFNHNYKFPIYKSLKKQLFKNK